MANIYYLVDGYDIYFSNEAKSGYSYGRPGSEVCTGMTKITIELTDDKFVLPSDASSLFAYSRSTIPKLNKFDTSECTNMSNMFYQAISNLSFTGVSNGDVSKVTNMQGMFSQTSSMYYLDVSNGDTSSCTDMSGMFFGAGHSGNNITINISNWDTSKVTTMEQMFRSCKVRAINLSGINTSSCTNMAEMFYMTSVATLDVSSFNTANVTTVKSMFESASALTSLDVSNFNLLKATSAERMFKGCSSLASLDVRNIDPRNIVSLDEMFSGIAITSLDIRGGDLRNATYMRSVFASCANLKYIRMEGAKFRTSGSSNQIVSDIFAGCTSLERVYASPNTDWNASSSMFGVNLFTGCTNILNGDGTVDIERANNVRSNGYFGIGTGDGYNYSVYEKSEDAGVQAEMYIKDSDNGDDPITLKVRELE